MEEIIVRYSIRFKDHLKAYLGDLLTNLFGFIYLVLVAGAMWFLYDFSGWFSFLVAAFIHLVFMALHVLAFSYCLLLWVFKYRKGLSRYIAFSQHGILIDNPGRKEWIDWEEVFGCDNSEHAFVLNYNEFRTLVISRDVLLENKAYMAFLNMLKAKGIRVGTNIEADSGFG